MKQNNYRTQGKKKNKAGSKGLQWKLLPLQFTLIVLPLVMYLFMDNSGYGVFPWNSVDDFYTDVFLRGKMIVFTVIAVIVFVMLLYKLLTMNKETRKQSLLLFIPMFIYAVCVCLSTLFSADQYGSVHGSMDQMEPIAVLLGYVCVLLYTFLVVETGEDLQQLIGAAVIGSLLMAVLGVLQALGYDPLLLTGIQKLFAYDFVTNHGALALTFPKGQAYGTLYNPNYVGTYVSLYTPLLLAGFLTFKEWWKKLVSALSFLGLMVMLFASQSRTGLVAIAAIGVVAFLFLSREIVKRWYLVIPGITLLVMVFSLIDTYRDNLLTNRLKAMVQIEKSQDALRAIDTTGNGVRVVYKDTEFTVRMIVTSSAFGYVVFEEGEEREVTYTEDGSYGYFTLADGEEMAIRTAVYENAYAFGLNLEDKTYYFTNQIDSGNYLYINDYGRMDECVMADNVFPGYEAVASGRGYVWGRTIPLLLKHFFLGSGPDTFAVTFPQNDYVARDKSGFGNIIFTRPHNFYLQMGVQTGTISLIAFLAFYLLYFVDCFKKYWFRKFTTPEEWIGFSLFLGTIGFMVSGLANDSLIVVTPLFYVMLGMGMAINHRFCPVYKREKRNKEENNTEE